MDDDGPKEESLKEESLQGPASRKLVVNIFCYMDKLAVGAPDVPLNGEEVEDDRITNKGRRKATNTDSDSDSDAAPVSREWKELLRANDD